MRLSGLLLSTLLALLPACTHGHGRLMDPPARNSMWRLGFANPVNYNDNELYCGGRMTQWARNNGKCGVCGDPHHSKREHEAGGKYANGIITREYKQGDVIDVTVHITANHKGFFEFRICPVQDPQVEVTQECLDEHVLEKADGNGTKYYLTDGQSNQFFNVSLRLPDDLSCQQCVIQWKYRTGNTWDKDESGKFCVGCGPQEEFYNCADVTINQKSKAALKSDIKNDKQKAIKAEIQSKKEAIVFTNGDQDTNLYNSNKMSDYGKQKAKFVQDSSKYSSLSVSARQPAMTRNVIQVEMPSTEVEPQVEKFNAGEDHSDNKNADMKNWSLDEPSVTLRQVSVTVRQVFPTNPPLVPYKWQVGTPKASAAEEIRKRFGYSIGNERTRGGYTNGGKRDEVDVETVVFVSKEGQVGSSQQDGVSGQHNAVSSQRVNGQANDVAQPIADQTKQQETNPIQVTLNLDQVNRDMAPSQSNPEEMNFLKRWKMLRLRHLAAQQALNISSGRATPTASGLRATPMASGVRATPTFAGGLVTTTAGVTKESRMQRLRQNLQNMREKGRNRQESKSPFTPPTATKIAKSKEEENETWQEKVETSKLSTTSKPSTISSRLQKYLKKRLPSWLMAALKMKQNEIRGQESDNDVIVPPTSTMSSTIGVRVNRDRKLSTTSGDVSRSGYSKRVPVVHDGNTKVDKDSDDVGKSYGARRSPSKNGPSWFGHLRPLNQQTQHLRSGSFETSPTITVTTSNHKGDKEENVNKNYSADAESLVRYIIATLLAKRSKEQDIGGQSEEQNQEIIKSKKANSDYVLSRSARPEPTQAPWYVPAVDESMSSGVSYNSELLPHTSDQHGFIAESSNSIRVDTKPYNGLILGTDYGYNQGYPGTARSQVSTARSQVRTPAARWESRSAWENHAAMNAYRASLNAFENNDIQLSHNGRPYSEGFTYPNNNNYMNTAASGHQQRQGWDNMDDVSNDFVQDPNHAWAMRAQQRQEYYQQQQQQQPESPQLVCEGLVTLGGGMDKWCTDNCNANFCPSTICVCKKQIQVSSHPLSSSYSSLNPRTPSVATWGGPRTASYSRPVVRRSQSPYYRPLSQNYDVTGQEAGRVGGRPQRKQHQQTSYLYPLLTTTYLDPVPTAPTFAAFSARNARGSFMPRHKPGTRVEGSRHTQVYAQPESYRSRTVSPRRPSSQFYPPSQNSISHRSVYNTNSNTIGESTLPLQMTWISGHKRADDAYDVTSGRRSPNLSSDKDTYLLVNLQDGVVDTNLRMQEQNHISTQYTEETSSDDSTVEQPARLNCRAVGAYRGLEHFDEWCESTCYTSMCPLLMCACDS